MHYLWICRETYPAFSCSEVLLLLPDLGKIKTNPASGAVGHLNSWLFSPLSNSAAETWGTGAKGMGLRDWFYVAGWVELNVVRVDEIMWKNEIYFCIRAFCVSCHPESFAACTWPSVAHPPPVTGFQAVSVLYCLQFNIWLWLHKAERAWPSLSGC